MAQQEWVKPRRFSRNLVVIGAGSAGLVAALVAAKAGAAVTLVERAEMGGDCLNTGCVPSKALIHAARLVARAREAAAMGLLAAPGPVDTRAAMRHVQASIAAVAPHDSIERFRGLGVDVRTGYARIVSPWCVEVDGEPLTTRAIVIATGAEPVVPDVPGLANTGYLTSETLWMLDAAPARLVVLGGGPIACELSQAFAQLGSSVTIIQRGDRLLEREDPTVSTLIRNRLEQDGVAVRTGADAIGATRQGGTRTLTIRHDGQEHEAACDEILVAVGRRPRTAGLGLEELDIPLRTDGTIESNAALQTIHPNIYVCGDVAGPFQFTHAAGHQGWHASINALFGQIHRIKPGGAMPWVTYTDPEVARVGLNEQEAAANNIAVEVTTYALAELDRAIVDTTTEGSVTILTAPGKDRILGATIIAPRAGEMMAELGLAMRAGIGLKGVFATIHPYPTYTEANRAAAGAWRARHAPDWLLPWLRRYHSWMRG